MDGGNAAWVAATMGGFMDVWVGGAVVGAW